MGGVRRFWAGEFNREDAKGEWGIGFMEGGIWLGGQRLGGAGPALLRQRALWGFGGGRNKLGVGAFLGGG